MSLALDYGRALQRNYRQIYSSNARSRAVVRPSIRPALPAVFYESTFTEDTIDATPWALATDAGATAYTIAAAGVAGGEISGSTGASDNEALAIYGHSILKGDKNAGMLATINIELVAGMFFEAGLCDPVSDFTLPAINDIDTPTITNGAVTLAMVCMDTDQTLQTAALITDGDSTYATAKTLLANRAGTAWAPTAATDFTVIIQTNGDTAEAVILDANGVPTAWASKTLGFEGGTLVQARVIVGNRDTNAKAVIIKKLAYWADE